MNWVPRPGLQVLLEPDCRLLLIERDVDEALPRTILNLVDSWSLQILQSAYAA